MASKEEKKMGREVEKVLRDAKRNVNREDYENAASLYNRASFLAHKIGDKRAVQYALEAAKFSLKIKKYFSAGWSYRNAALFSKDFKNFDNAINFALKAIEYFSRTNSFYAVQWCYNLAGEANEEKGDYLSAAKYYRKSLEIEKDKDIEKRIKRILKEVPHPTVEQTADKEEAKEGEEIEFRIKIKNESPETLSNIRVLNEDNEKLCFLESIEPGNEKLFTLKIRARGVGTMLSPFKKVQWKTKNKQLERDIEPYEVLVEPNIEIKPYLKNKLRIGKYSYFVVSVRNNSSSPITDIKLSVDFPVELKVKPVTGYYLEKISSSEEKGFVFEVLPTIVGKTRTAARIRFMDSEGREHVKRVESFLLEDVSEPPKGMGIEEPPSRSLPKEDFERMKRAQELKKYLSSLISPLEISEPEYVSMTKKFYYATNGCTLKDVDVGTVSKHVLEECRGAKLIGAHEFEEGSLYLFAGYSIKEERTYLLTVVVKGEEKIVHLALKLYSDKKENLEDTLSKILEIIKHTVVVMSLAKEVEKIEVKKIINIIDSIVQRSDIGTGEGEEEDKEIEVKDSVVQRTKL